MKKVYGYLFKVIAEKVDSGYVAYAPGVGGVYEEGKTRSEAISNAYEAACAILEVRFQRNDLILEDSDNLKLLTAPPQRQYIARIPNLKDGYIATPCCAVPSV
ncbi:MAG: type II toxin-antitoxin system HicB family antitoxin [Chloroflexi bacterium]|nr:type II toxin-antitoxin system HicB family antitoxin [Chloroflexota bacterium]